MFYENTTKIVQNKRRLKDNQKKLKKNKIRIFEINGKPQNGRRIHRVILFRT